eukprot:9731106-Alexandrium_andersonii.AAC.1
MCIRDRNTPKESTGLRVAAAPRGAQETQTAFSGLKRSYCGVGSRPSRRSARRPALVLAAPPA